MRLCTWLRVRVRVRVRFRVRARVRVRIKVGIRVRVRLRVRLRVGVRVRVRLALVHLTGLEGRVIRPRAPIVKLGLDRDLVLIWLLLGEKCRIDAVACDAS